MTLVNYIDHISRLCYYKISDISSCNLNMAELGSTDYLVYLLEKGRRRFPNLKGLYEVYKSGAKEKTYGHDFDFFIKNNKGSYYRFALQAKRMVYTGKYEDINKKGGKEQWEKLKDHEKDFQSKAFYLLYNGQPYKYNKAVVLTTSSLKTDCISTLKIEDLGLGLLERAFVEKQMNSKSSFSFQDSYNEMDSLRLIFCCVDSFKDMHEYPESDVIKMKNALLERFKKIEVNIEQNEEQNEFFIKNGLGENVIFIG